jgi:hypothetical protein
MPTLPKRQTNKRGKPHLDRHV